MTEMFHNLPYADCSNDVIKSTTHRREWWGWFGTANWLIFMMYGFSLFILPNLRNGEIQVSDFNFYFMIIFGAAIIAFSLCFGKDLGRLSRIAFFTTPVAIIFTVAFPLLPTTFGVALYLVSPIGMAPALVRRVFGVLHTAPAGKQLTSYISAIAVSYICYSIWLTGKPQKEIAFLFPALLAIPALVGIRRTIKPPKIVAKSSFVFSWKYLFGFIVTAGLLLWIATMNAIIFTNILSAGIATSDILISLLSYGLPGISYLLYASISDKGHERAGLTISVMLFISGVFIGLLPGNTQGPWLILLTVAITMGGSYFEFLFLSIPIYFLASAKRPLFVASLGIVVELMFSALLWKTGYWVPQIFWSFGSPLLYSAAFSAVVFVIIISFLFERYREKTLAAVLHTLLYKAENNIEEQAIVPGKTQVAERQSLASLALTQQEIEVALLLVEGKTRSEITRKLRLKSSEATNLVTSIRDKIGGGNPNPRLTTAAKQYKLTRRESEMLSYLQNGMTNRQIAEELFLSEATVKNHVYSLLNKLPIKTRQEIPAWMETMESNTQ